MQRLLIAAAALVLVVHGFVHLLGTAAYLKLATVPNLPYKTTFLNGAWDIGNNGVRVLGVLWAVAAVGFIVGAAGMVGRAPWWHVVLLTVTCLSLALTTLDWTVAYAGVVVDVVILLALLFVPR